MALAKVGGETVGAMLYNLRDEDDAGRTLEAYRFYNDTSRGALSAAAMDRTPMPIRPDKRSSGCGASEPAGDVVPRSAGHGRVVWGPMARIVDVTGIQGMPVGPPASRPISPTSCPWNDGNWRFEAVDGRLRVSRSDTADCELAIQGLTGLVFGTHSAADFAFVAGPSPHARRRRQCRRSSRRAPPYLHESSLRLSVWHRPTPGLYLRVTLSSPSVVALMPRGPMSETTVVPGVARYVVRRGAFAIACGTCYTRRANRVSRITDK